MKHENLFTSNTMVCIYIYIYIFGQNTVQSEEERFSTFAHARFSETQPRLSVHCIRQKQ
jgi:hypothetical protein